MPRSGAHPSSERGDGSFPGWVHAIICFSFLDVYLFMWGWGIQPALAHYEGHRQRAQTASPLSAWVLGIRLRSLGLGEHLYPLGRVVLSCGSDNTL